MAATTATVDFQLAVIGGGIAGLGVALEAGKRGIKTAIFDKDDFGQLTSANSHHIIHGGLRYLQNLDFKRTIESISAKRKIFNYAPECVSHLPCIMPVNNKKLTRNIFSLSLAAKFFSLLDNDREHAPGIIKASQLVKEADFFSRHFPQGAFCWFDGLIKDHQKLVAVIDSDLGKYGVTTYRKTRVLKVDLSDNLNKLHVNSNNGETQTFSAASIVNASGSALNELNTTSQLPASDYKWCRAFNIILDKLYETKYGVGVQSAEGRLYFFVPRNEGRTAVGTGYLPLLPDSSDRSIKEEELTVFLDDVSKTIGHQFKLNDIHRVESGILPVDHYHGDLPVLVSKDRIIRYKNYFTLIPTKYTTFMTHAEKVINQITGTTNI